MFQSKKCNVPTKRGTPCQAYPVSGSVLCFNHDPHYREEKRQAVIKGGQATKKLYESNYEKKITFHSKKDLMKALERTVNKLLSTGPMTEKKANTISRITRQIQGLLYDSDDREASLPDWGFRM